MSNLSDVVIIENDRKSKEDFGFNYGYEEYEIDSEDISALIEGKTLATTIGCGEYSIFITLKKGDE